MRCCWAEISGPISLVSSVGSRTRIPVTAGSSSDRNSSYADRSTRIRDRAQQSCPALSKTAYGALAAAAARSASAKTMLELLPPSSSVTRFTWSAQPAMIFLPTAVEPVKHDLAHQRVGDEPLADHAALAGDDRQHVLGQAGLEGELGDPDRGQRGELGGLEDDGVAGGQRRCHAPGQDRHREVPRHDDPDHAERLVEGQVDAAGDRDLPAEHPLRRRRVVVEAVADVAGLPARVAPGVSGVADLELGQLLDVVVDDRGEPAQERGPVARRHRPPGGERLVRPLDRGVGLLDGSQRGPRSPGWRWPG